MEIIGIAYYNVVNYYYSVALQGLAWHASKTPLSTPEGQSIE